MDLTDAARLARELLDEHGLQTWTLTFDRAKRRAGICRYAERQIGLSAPLTAIHPEAEVRDTILHEIAHALVGPQHGHDGFWQATARRIGCSGMRSTSQDAPRIEGSWVGTCPAGHRVSRHRRPGRPTACRTCSPTFDLANLFTWTHHGKPAPMLPGYEAELARITAAVTRPAPPVVRLRLGDRLQVTAPGSKYDGVTGTLVKRGRTRFHLRVGRSVMTVPFAMARPVEDSAARPR